MWFTFTLVTKLNMLSIPEDNRKQTLQREMFRSDGYLIKCTLTMKIESFEPVLPVFEPNSYVLYNLSEIIGKPQ